MPSTLYGGVLIRENVQTVGFMCITGSTFGRIVKSVLGNNALLIQP